MCDLSIVIVNWNAKDFLLQALESIAATVARHTYETIVVDNGSHDGGPEAVEAAWPCVRLIRNGANLGFAKANNIGIRVARGRFVALVNSDVTLLPECLDRLVDFMDQHSAAGIAGPMILNPDGTLQHSIWRFPSILGALARTLALDTLWQRRRARDPNHGRAGHATKVDALSGCVMLLRPEALENSGLLDEDFYIYGEDTDLCRRFHADGWDVIYNPEARAIHAGGASSAGAPVRFFIEMQKANLHYWRKHYGRAGALFFLTNALIHHLLRLAGGVIMLAVRPALKSQISHKNQRSAACIRWIFGLRNAECGMRNCSSPSVSEGLHTTDS